MTTPKTLLDMLDLITAPEIASPQLLYRKRTAIKQFERVQTIFDDPNIIGAGIAHKVTDGESTDDLALVFYVREKLTSRDLSPSTTLPSVLAAPNGRAVFTDVVELGDLVPQQTASQSYNIQNTPIQSGFSVGHKDITAGTVAAVVHKDGKRFILSNSHVLAASGLAALGDHVVYPGPADGGDIPANVVARLSTFIPFVVDSNSFVNTVDAALAEVDPAFVPTINDQIWNVSSTLEVSQPARGMKVFKRGRTTGDTDSIITDVNFRILIRYPDVGTVGFTGQVLCKNYTAGGDSGALVIDSGTGRIVGLHFAGSSKGSVFTPIQMVMDELKFSF